jgi:hypothetical protein
MTQCSIPEKKRRLADTVDTLESLMNELEGYDLINVLLSPEYLRALNNLYNIDINEFRHHVHEVTKIMNITNKLLATEESRRKKDSEIKTAEREEGIRKIAKAKKESKSRRELPSINAEVSGAETSTNPPTQRMDQR